MHAFCRDQRLWFILGQGTIAVLKARVVPTLAEAQTLYEAAPAPHAVRLFTHFGYQASTWAQPLRLVAKVELSPMGTNVRFVTTNLHSGQPSFLYQQAYAGRGQMENFKNHKTFLHSDRTSCHRFEANQFRLLPHSAAYLLLHALQELLLAGTQFQQAAFDILQRCLQKSAPASSSSLLSSASTYPPPSRCRSSIA